MAVTLGPLVLSLSRVFLLLGLASALLVAQYLRRRHGSTSDAALWIAAAVGFVVARLAYVLAHRDYFGQQPLDALKLWQGGFEPLSGLLAAAFTALLLVRLGARPWRPVFLPLTAGVLTWAALNWLSLAFERGTQHALPDLALETLSGDQVTLTQFQGRPVVVNLWASWCPPCRAEMPVLALAERENSAITFLFVNQGEDVATMERYLDEEELSLTHVLRDPFSSASRELAARAMPTTFFFGADGQLVSSYTGELSYPRLNDFIERLR